jgi:hypothetical protein
MYSRLKKRGAVAYYDAQKATEKTATEYGGIS